MKGPQVLRVIAILAVLAGAGIALVFLPIKEYLVQFLGWVQGIGGWGAVVLAALYTPACLLFVPGSILTLGAGFAFGVVRGAIAASLGSVVGASAAFLAGRTLARGLIEERIARNPKFRAIDRAVAEEGFKIVLLTRLSPVFPFNLLNYAFSLTGVRFRDYVLASWIGMLPGSILYAYLGSAVKSLADLVAGRVEGGVAQKVLFFVGLIATVVVAVLVTRLARRSLNKAMEPRADRPAEVGEGAGQGGPAREADPDVRMAPL